MVLLNGNKYACETCIKGHRSSTCRHTDRPLFEIKKKGRPVTQCEHCRELRKTKQVHVKCICEAKEHLTAHQSSGIKKGHTKIPDSAAFPLGLPEALGASVAPQSPEGHSPVSDHGGAVPSCATGGDLCKCCTPRKSAAPKHYRKRDTAPLPNPESHCTPSASASSRTPSHILSRLAELRPVLPRPSSYHTRSNSGPSHDPSMNIPHGHPQHRRSHEILHFSPYGRAYDVTHEQFDGVDADQNSTTTTSPVTRNDVSSAPSASSVPIFPTDEQTFRDQLRALEAVTGSSSWVPPPGAEFTIPSFPSACGCGDVCRCPGCVHHNPGTAPDSSAFSSCCNPNGCSTCLDCTILSLPASLPPDTALSIFDGYQADTIDEWIRQVSSLPRVSPGIPISTNGSGMGTYTAQDEQQQQQSTTWNNGRLPPITEPPPSEFTFPGYKVQPCCGVLCKCNPEECECNIDDENGYDCRREMLIPTFSDRSESPTHTSSMATDEVAPFSLTSPSGDASAVYIDAGGFQSVTGPPRSRSSSVSSSRSQSGNHSPPYHQHQQQQQQQSHIFTPQPLSSEYYLGQLSLITRGRAGAGGGGQPFYTTSSSVSSPNLVTTGLRVQTTTAVTDPRAPSYHHQPISSSSSSPAASVSVSPARSAPGNNNNNNNNSNGHFHYQYHQYHRGVTSSPYAASNPDSSDGYLSAAEEGHGHAAAATTRRWIE